MDKDMLTTFDDDALDQVSGGYDIGVVGAAVVEWAVSGHEDRKDYVGSRLESLGDLLKVIGGEIKK